VVGLDITVLITPEFRESRWAGWSQPDPFSLTFVLPIAKLRGWARLTQRVFTLQWLIAPLQVQDEREGN
jgi:hypothetical protein